MSNPQETSRYVEICDLLHIIGPEIDTKRGHEAWLKLCRILLGYCPTREQVCNYKPRKHYPSDEGYRCADCTAIIDEHGNCDCGTQ